MQNGALDSSITGQFFISKYHGLGTYLWTRPFAYLAAQSTIAGAAIGIDSSSNVYVTGSFSGAGDFNPDPGISERHASFGLTDGFVSKIDVNGVYQWTKIFGGTNVDRALDMVGDGSRFYIVGDFMGTANFNTDGGADKRTAVGNQDLFLLRMGP